MCIYKPTPPHAATRWVLPVTSFQTKLQKSRMWVLSPPASRLRLAVSSGTFIKQVVVFSKKWKRFVFLFQFSASQRGEAYSTPRNWCLINLPFLMWDVVTWSYFFPSPSAETRGNSYRREGWRWWVTQLSSIYPQKQFFQMMLLLTYFYMSFTLALLLINTSTRGGSTELV